MENSTILSHLPIQYGIWRPSIGFVIPSLLLTAATRCYYKFLTTKSCPLCCWGRQGPEDWEDTAQEKSWDMGKPFLRRLGITGRSTANLRRAPCKQMHWIWIWGVMLFDRNTACGRALGSVWIPQVCTPTFSLSPCLPLSLRSFAILLENDRYIGQFSSSDGDGLFSSSWGSCLAVARNTITNKCRLHSGKQFPPILVIW